ncbi:MAG: serine/threonine protein kinase [Gammaproteobacteria bacterium]|nr:serine/threonine protein kinase [Gammaproteobacteria bacterium]MBU1655041.1 serine/threonine protein kinase [Gammaproteobacteria bacterium]MBU1961538.1 serine/threonine protein kinase [Gammaproteobacteria bacterium]
MKSYSHTLPINEKVGGRYRVQAILGEGGFGITYRAWDEKLERLVVIKEYLPGEMGVRDGDTLRVLPRTNREDDFLYGLNKYLDEAKALARFQHPNIVRIIDHLEAFGTAYIVMEYEEGETLADHLKKRGSRLNEEEILSLFIVLLQGLREVHRAGLLHRDIKPGNIFLRKSGGPLLIDFGAARHALGEHSKSISAVVSQGFAPPEQYSNRSKQGPFTDIYALGAVLYELITGEAPLESVERSHCLNEGEPDPLPSAQTAGQGRVAPWLLELDDWLLRIPSRDRPQDCDEVLKVIATHWEGERAPDLAPVVTAHPVTRQATLVMDEAERFRDASTTGIGGGMRKRWTNPVLASLVGVSAIIALGYYFVGRGLSGVSIEPLLQQGAVQGTGVDTIEVLPPASAVADRQGSPPAGSLSVAAVTPEAAVPPADEADYAVVREIDTSYAYQLYLRKYPDGRHASAARERMVILRK